MQSCYSEEKINTLKIIDPVTSNEKYDLLNHVESLEYIPLKESESALLSIVVDMKKYQDQYIVKCYNRSALFFFDSEGNFLKKIIATGEGPYEFSNLMDIAFDEKDEKIYLLDFDQKKILTYDLKNDKILNTEKGLNLHSYSIAHYKSKIFAISMNDNSGIIKIYDDDTMNQLGAGVYGKHPIFNRLVTQKNMEVFQDTLFISASFSDTIYYSNGKMIKPYAVLGVGNTSLSSINNQPDFETRVNSNFKVSESEKKILTPRGFFSVYNNIWFIEMVWPYQMIVWDRKKEVQKLIDFRNIKNRSLLYNYQMFKILFVDEMGYAYSSIILNDKFYQAAENVINSENYSSTIRNEIKKILKKYPKNAGFENPVIVKYKINADFYYSL
ncbi:MAG: hypothetical protein Sapg2KO_41780 [Saprospiraceae bacterium]